MKKNILIAILLGFALYYKGANYNLERDRARCEGPRYPMIYESEIKT